MKKNSLKSYKIYWSLSAVCGVLLFWNIFRTDSWTGEMPLSEFGRKEWSLFWLFVAEEILICVVMFVFALMGGKRYRVQEKDKIEAFSNGLLRAGLVDSRKLSGVATAQKLPNGEFGLCMLCLNESSLNLYDTGLDQAVGELLYSIDLKKVKNLKTKASAFNSYIKFTYEGFEYKLTNCASKELCSAIEREAR